MRTLATYLLFSGVIVGLYAAVVASLNTSARRVAALNDGTVARDLYEAVCIDHGFDPLEGQP